MELNGGAGRGRGRMMQCGGGVRTAFSVTFSQVSVLTCLWAFAHVDLFA